MKLSTLLVSSLALGAVVAGCKAKTGDAASDASTTAMPMSASAGASAKPADMAPADVPLDQFIGKISPSTCKMLDDCKNDKVKVVVATSAILVASFGSMDNPEAQKQISAIDKSMKADKRFLPNNAECNTIGGVALGVLGMKADAIQPKVGKTVAYDGKKAAACLASISTPPDACKTEAKVTTEPKMKDIDSMSSELKPALESYAKACEEVMTGLVDAGGACEYEFECKGKDMKCKSTGSGKTKTKTCAAKK